MDRRSLTLAGVALVVLYVLAKRPVQLLETGGTPSPVIDPRTIPIGAYAGHPPLPMTPSVMLQDELLDSMTGVSGLRLGGSSAQNATYFGSDVVPAPVYARGRINREVDLEVAPIEANQRSNAGAGLS